MRGLGIGSGLPRLNWGSGNINAVAVGNSLVEGVPNGNATAWPAVLSTLAPISNAFTIRNRGHNGYSLATMTASAATDVDPFYVPGETNVLFALEGTNAAIAGGTGAQMYADTQTFCNRVLVNPWYIVWIATPPFTQDYTNQASTNDVNARVDDFNARMRAGYRSLGIKAFVDIRDAASFYHFADYTQASFDASALNGYWDGPATTARVHDTPAGYAAVAGLIAARIKRLPRR